MQAATSDSADFTGVFVKWQYQPGQKYIQLIFETAAGARLSLSRNRHLVRSLTVGRHYRIKGRELLIGGKSYIHEPTAIPMPFTAKPGRKLKFIVSTVLLVIVMGAGSALALTNTKSQSSNADTKKSVVERQSAAQASLASSKAAAAPQTAPAAPTPAVPALSTAAKTTTKRTAASSVPVTPPAQPATPATSAVVPVLEAAPAVNNDSAGSEPATAPIENPVIPDPGATPNSGVPPADTVPPTE